MLENAETMFDNLDLMLKKLKKKSYEENMRQFLWKNQHYFQEMTDHMDAAQEKDKAAGEIAAALGDCVENRFGKGEKKKISSRMQADINFFMIYYIFPSILKTEHEDCRLIADTICAEWKRRFKDSAIGYTDYDSLYESFREKIFGIF